MHEIVGHVRFGSRMHIFPFVSGVSPIYYYSLARPLPQQHFMQSYVILKKPPPMTHHEKNDMDKHTNMNVMSM